MEAPREIDVGGIKYVREDTRPTGNRAVVVVDRGWIFAGDVTDENGRIRLTRAVWLFRWERLGFAAVVNNPKADGVDIRKISDVDIPADAELFRIPVPTTWGL